MNNYCPGENRALLITADFLRGAAVEDTDSFLQNLANRNQKSALALFHEANSPYDIADILKILVSKNEVDKYKVEYETWLDTKQISHDLIYLLEFLALKGFHRLHFFLKRVSKIKPAQNLQHVYSGLALTTCGAAIAFYLRPEWWNVSLEAIMVTAPSVGIWLIKYILIPQNLAVLMIGYILFQTLANIYIILDKNSTSTEHKTNKILRQVISCMLNVGAQALCFMSFGIMSQVAAWLFITAALFEMLWNLLEYRQLSQPLSLNDADRKCLFKRIQYDDELAYFIRKEKQLFIAFVALVLISIATTLSILFGSQLAFVSVLSIAFQWLVSRYKDSAVENTEVEIAQKLQKKIFGYYPARYAQGASGHLDLIREIAESNDAPEDKIVTIMSTFQSGSLHPLQIDASQNKLYKS
jgi:hypothetical protein